MNLVSRGKLETYVEPYNDRLRFALKIGKVVEWILFWKQEIV